MSEVSTKLTVNQLPDTAQDLPDDVWDYVGQQISEPDTQSSLNEHLAFLDVPTDELSLAMLT